MSFRPSFAATLCNCLALALVACQSVAPGPRVDGEAIVEAAGPDQGVIRGSATYYEKLRMPPDSVLSVRLVDRDAPEDSRQAIVAEAAFSDIPGPPYAFVLPYDPAKLHADGRYGITATLTTPQGEIFFATPEPVAVTPGSQTPIEFRMLRTEAP